MKSWLLEIGGLLAAVAVCAAPTGNWRFESGKTGEAAGAVASEANGAALSGKAGVYEKGSLPVYSDNVPFKQLWDSVEARPVVQENRVSLRFNAPDGVAGAAPVGGEVVVSGKDEAAKPGSFTAEAFVKVARATARHALVLSKRRNGQSGASWSLSITPGGALGVRFDTQPGAANSGDGFNQCVGSSARVDDGEWHHVALAVDGAAQTAALYVDHVKCGGGSIRNPLVYDLSDLVMGRGLDGWLDEVRLTPEVLHPEQMLRPARFFSELKPPVMSVPLLDQTPTRVQSALKPELAKIGTLIPKGVKELSTSMWSLGCETLDRDLANWDAYKGYLEPLGIRRIRLQGGWGRTEKQKGVYDFAWLDRIVDDAHARGLTVCLETSYGNRLYEKNAAGGPGGLLPAGEETLAAWDRWVEAMVKHYAPKGVHEWMMFNEPNLRKENTAELIVANNVRTAEIIKRLDPQAKVGAFVLAGLNLDLIKTMLESIKGQGKLDLFDWAIYHGYSGNPDRLNGRMAEFNAMLAHVAPRIRPWQGEAGCASEEVQFALSGIDWTEYSHAKWNARRMLCDIGNGVESSVFTITDLSYHKDFISRYGLIKTNPDNSVIKVKTAYYTVQNVVTVFNDALARVPDYALTATGVDTNLTWFAFRDKQSGLDAVALWNGSEIPSNGSEIEKVRLVVKGGRFKEPVWLDLVTGNLYAIPMEQVTVEGESVCLNDIPVYDGPAAIIDRSLLSFVPAREKKGAKGATAKPAATAAAAVESLFAKHLLPGTQQPAPALLIFASKGAPAADTVAWLNAQEVHAFVAEVDGQAVTDAALAKAQRALVQIRGRAAEWQVKADAVGVMGLGQNATEVALAMVGKADFAVLLDVAGERVDKQVPAAKRKTVFVGARSGYEKPLSAWLEKHKGKVF